MDPKEIDAQIAALKAEIANLQVLKSKASSSPGGEMTMKELLGKLGDPRAAIVSDDPVSEAGRSKAVPSLSQYLKQQEDTKDLSFGDSVEARVSEGEREMTMKELLEKLNDPRAAIVSDDPVSEADKSKAVPSLSQYQKQQEDKQALFESLDRAEAAADLAAKKMIKGPTKLDPKTGKPLESGSGLLKGPDKFDPANKTEIIPAELDPEYFPEGVLTDEGFGRQARDRRRKEEESAAVARRKEAGLPPLSPSEALRVEGEAKAEARRKGFDSLPYDDPIWLGEKPAAEPTGPATAAYEALDDEDQVAQAFEEAAAAAAPAPAKAEALPISEDDEALRLFRVAHGGAFDPKSSTDKRKIDEVRQLLAEQGGQGDMTDNQFALKLYREYGYV